MLQQIQGQQFICRLGFSPRARMYIFKFSREKNSTLFSISPSSERSEELWVVCGFIRRKWSCAIVVQAGHHHAQQIDRRSALQTAEKENTDRIHLLLHFTLTSTQFNLSFLKILNFSKTIQRLALSFLNPHLFHSNVTKTQATF